MPTPLYRFHCTNGLSLVADLRGKRLPSVALMRFYAERAALDLMRSDEQADWSAWHVEVYDAKGRSVLRMAFMHIRDTRFTG